MERIRIGFLGYGTRALDSLMAHPLFDVRCFLAPGTRLCRDVFDAQERYRDTITMEIVDNNEQLAAYFARERDVDCFLMNACPIILNQEVLSMMDVYNIHPGDLRYNRGHHPHCWTVRLGERQTKIVLHEVSEEIDSGAVVKSVDIAVSEEDSAGDVLDHAEDQIPILLDALYRHLTEHTGYETVVADGGYRPMMSYRDYEIDVTADTKELIQRKILCRSLHHGAFFRDGARRVYVDRILSCREQEQAVSNEVTACIREKEGVVYIDSPRYSMSFHLNKIEEIH